MQNHEVNGVQAQKKDGIDGIHAEKGAADGPQIILAGRH